MSKQLALLQDPVETRFIEWLRDNGAVVDAFRESALAWYRAGHDKGSAKMIAEVIRWERGLGGHKDEDGFKVNNTFVSRLGRHVVATTPELPSNFFEQRVLRSDRDAI